MGGARKHAIVLLEVHSDNTPLRMSGILHFIQSPYGNWPTSPQTTLTRVEGTVGLELPSLKAPTRKSLTSTFRTLRGA